MLETLTPDIIAAEVEMTRTAFKGAILIIEGKNDEKFYKKFIDDNSCHIVVAHGKQNVLQSIEKLNNVAFNGVIAIVDSDFWRIDGMPNVPNNVFVTDTHDSEGMVFCSEAFDRITTEYCSREKLQKYDDLRCYLYENSRPIGYLRLTSNQNNLNLVFNDLDYKKITNKNTIMVDVNKLVTHIMNLTKANTDRKSLNQNSLTDESIISSYNDVSENFFQCSNEDLCCGHDVIGLFAIGLRRLFASLPALTANKENIEKIFRLSYDFKDFIKTELFDSISIWEQNNPTFKVLKQ